MMRSGIDCKGQKWEEIPLKTAKDISNQTYNFLTAQFRVAAPNGKKTALGGYLNVNVVI